MTRAVQAVFLRRFKFVDNTSSNSYDLLIMNITESDEGIYYCGTQHKNVEEKDHIAPKTDHSYGNIKTRIILSKYYGLKYHFIWNICNPVTTFSQ